MRIRMVDGTVQFATHVIKVDNEEFNIFSDSELQIEQDRLTKEEKTFVVESVTFPQEVIDRAKDVKYQSRSEALKHLQSDVVPEQMKQINLEQENIQLKEKLQMVEDTLLVLMFSEVQ